MKQILIVAKKELRDYFSSPVAYIILTVFAIVLGGYFSRFIFADNQASLRKLFEFIPLVWIVFIPAMTMKSFAEELKSGTLEVIATLPLSKLEIILGKILANLVLAITMLALTLPALITVSYLGNPDSGQIIAGYLGLVLVAAVYITVGVLISLNSKNQIAAFILSACVIAVLYFVGEAMVLERFPVQYRDYLEFFGLGAHFRSIARGVLDTRDLLYYLTVLVISFVLTMLSFNKLTEKGK